MPLLTPPTRLAKLLPRLAKLLVLLAKPLPRLEKLLALLLVPLVKLLVLPLELLVLLLATLLPRLEKLLVLLAMLLPRLEKPLVLLLVLLLLALPLLLPATNRFTKRPKGEFPLGTRLFFSFTLSANKYPPAGCGEICQA
jgi:hypothetical protein